MGYPQALDVFTDLINKYMGTKMSSFGTTFRANAAYPVFMEILYIREILSRMLVNLSDTFMACSISYILDWNYYIMNLVYLGWLNLLFYLTICLIYLYKVR